jgi:hypothetical protein
LAVAVPTKVVKLSDAAASAIPDSIDAEYAELAASADLSQCPLDDEPDEQE